MQILLTFYMKNLKYNKLLEHCTKLRFFLEYLFHKYQSFNLKCKSTEG